MKTTPDILFQHKVLKHPGKPEREFLFIPAQIPVFKYNPYLNFSNNWLFGGVGKYEQIKKFSDKQMKQTKLNSII